MISKDYRMINKIRIRNHILFNHPEWYAMRLWLSTIVNKQKFTRRLDPSNGIDVPNIVLGGPFRGMKYDIEAVWSERYPKILGTYEKEIHPTIETIFGFSYDQLVNIGSAEGYYAVGFARKLQFEDIITVDPLSDSHEKLKRLSSDNDITRIKHMKWMSLRELNRVLSNKKTLLMIDCEGGEAGYLNSKLVRNLRFSDVLVEVHDFLISDLSQMIMRANASTHRISLIEQEERKVSDLPMEFIVQESDPVSLMAMMDEKRPRNLRWLYMESINLHGG